MTLTEKYIGKVLPYLELDASVVDGKLLTKPKNGKTGYYFPCPKCSGLENKPYKKRARTACIIPKQQINNVYDYHCSRCSTHESFGNFLIWYKPALGKKYKFEKEHCT